MSEAAAMKGNSKGWKTWLDAALGFLYPNICQTCFSERATVRDGYVCQHCRNRATGVRYITVPLCQRCGLPFAGELTTPFACGNCQETTLHFEWARASVVLTDLMKTVIHAYKYRQAFWYEPFLFELLLDRAMPALSGAPPDVIVPVPLYPAKERARQFNQADRIGSCLARALAIPEGKSLVRRIKPTKTQTRLRKADRADNVAGAFKFCGRKRLSGERILLVDDVLTTGATTNACAEELMAHGAGSVCVWTIARGTLQ